jgi:hypothetical protein
VSSHSPSLSVAPARRLPSSPRSQCHATEADSTLVLGLVPVRSRRSALHNGHGHGLRLMVTSTHTNLACNALGCARYQPARCFSARKSLRRLPDGGHLAVCHVTTNNLSPAGCSSSKWRRPHSTPHRPQPGGPSGGTDQSMPNAGRLCRNTCVCECRGQWVGKALSLG